MSGLGLLLRGRMRDSAAAPFGSTSTDAMAGRGVGAGVDLLAPRDSGPSPWWAIGAATFAGLSAGYANMNAVRQDRYRQRSQASAFAFSSRMREMDRRHAERRAMSLLEQGQSDAVRIRREGAQARATTRTVAAARGIRLDSDSVREQLAGEQYVEDLEVYHVNLAAVRAASAARMEAVGVGSRALFDRTSAANLRRSAATAAPEAQLLGGLAQAGLRAAEIDAYRRR